MKSMKKTLTLLLLIVAIVVPANLTSAAATPIKVILYGEELKFPVNPFIEHGVTLVPFRSIFEAVGMSVNYNPASKTITGTNKTTAIKLFIGKKQAIVNGKTVTLDVATKTIKGTTLVPLRFVAENSGYSVRTDSKKIYLKKSPIKETIDGTEYLVYGFEEDPIEIGITNQTKDTKSGFSHYKVFFRNPTKKPVYIGDYFLKALNTADRYVTYSGQHKSGYYTDWGNITLKPGENIFADVLIDDVKNNVNGYQVYLNGNLVDTIKMP